MKSCFLVRDKILKILQEIVILLISQKKKPIPTTYRRIGAAYYAPSAPQYSSCLFLYFSKNYFFTYLFIRIEGDRIFMYVSTYLVILQLPHASRQACTHTAVYKDESIRTFEA